MTQIKAREDLPSSLVENILCDIRENFAGYDAPESKGQKHGKTFYRAKTPRAKKTVPVSPNLAYFVSLRE
jgi:hypothetical protein